MRLTTIVLAGITATTALAGSATAQTGTHLAVRGISPFFFDREEDAVRRAFQSVLNRQPTSSELRRYKGLMEDERWTEADVRRDLSSRSDYYRYSTNRGMRPEAIIRRAYQDILGRDPDAEGMRTYRSNIVDRGWTEQDVREALRNSPEYQTGAARTASADRIINRAYQDILGRQPDPEGLNTYRRNIIERGWDEQDVRTALRRSQERHDIARSSQRNVSDAEASDMVRRAYQTVLKREPDPSGMQEYKARILNDRWTEQQVVSALRSSPERREVARAQRNISDAEAEAMVRRAYQSVLNREPDAGGLRDYKAKVMNDHWTEQQLVNALRNSDEYRSKH
jgi:TorA maturation chaperone TorD